MDYDIAYRKKKRKLKEVILLQKVKAFDFLAQTFKEITQKLFQICLTPWKINWYHSIIQLPTAWNHYWWSVQSQPK